MEETETDQIGVEAVEISQGLLAGLSEFSISLLRPWNAYQVVIVVGLILLAYGLKRWLAPLYYNWLHTRSGWPMSRMRWAVVIHKRLLLIFFVILIWITTTFMQEITWPSRSYLIAIVANLALAWLVVALATRLIANKFLRQVVRFGAWV